MVVGIDQTIICSLTLVIPSILLTTQNRLSLKYEKHIAPNAAAWAASTGSSPMLETIGAAIEAAVIIATVPLPCTRRTKVAIKKGISIAGTLHVATYSDTLLYRNLRSSGAEQLDCSTDYS